MSVFGKRLRMLREKADLSQAQLAARIGKSKSSVNMYERGDREPGFETLEAIADMFNVDMDYLLGKSDVANHYQYDRKYKKVPDDIMSMPGIFPLPHFVKKPRLGTISCGEPIMSEENFEGYDAVPDDIDCDFTLIAHGDSMIGARIHDGDVVYVKHQDIVENGQIAVVMIDDEKTLKRFYKDGDKVTLLPENTAYTPLVYVGAELANIRILGRAVAFSSLIR